MFTHPYISSKIISRRRLDVLAAAGQQPPAHQLRTQARALRRSRAHRRFLRRALRAAITGRIENPA